MLVDREPELLGTIGGPDPRALHADPTSAEGDLTRLVAVAHGRAIGVVATPGADDLGDFFFHQLGQDAQADADRQGQKALLGSSDELSERLLDALGQYVLMLRAGLLGRYLVINGGTPCDLG